MVFTNTRGRTPKQLAGMVTQAIVNGAAPPPPTITPAGGDAAYVTLAADALLPNERVLTAGAGINIVDGGPGNPVTVINTSYGGGGTTAGGIPDWVVHHPDTPWATPTAESDGFEAATLAAKWAVLANTADALNYHATWKSHVFARPSGGTQLVQLSQAFAPRGDFSLTAKAIHSPSQNFMAAGLYASSASGNDQVRADWSFTTPGSAIDLSTRDAGTWAFNRSVVALGYGAGFVYLHLQRIGTL